MQSSQEESSLVTTAFPKFYHVYKLLSVSRNNLFIQIKFQLILMYFAHFLLNGFMFKEFAANLLTGAFFICFLFISLQKSIMDLFHYINSAFLVVFVLLIFNHGSYSHQIGVYLPQLSLIITNNRRFAVLLQGFLFFSSVCFKVERISQNELYYSSFLIVILLLMLNILHDGGLKTQNLKAHLDSLEAQLNSSKTHIKQSQSFYKDFHLALSHEFRNSLNNVMGNLELAMQKDQTSDSCSTQEHIRLAKMGCDVLHNSLNNTLDFCKSEFEEIDVNYVSVNIRKCLEKSWSIFTEILKHRNLHGELYLHAHVPPMVMVDPGRLHQILFNLVHNASKFTTKGFVKIIVSWHPSFVSNGDTASTSIAFGSQSQFSRVSNGLRSQEQIHSYSSKRTSTPDNLKHTSSVDLTFEDDFSEYPCNSQKITFSPSMNYNKLDILTKKFPKMHKRSLPGISTEGLGFLKIQVVDSGVGIHSSNLSKVFQKLSKFSSDSPRLEGGGFGLWVTKKICNKMDGTIHVHSDLNKGSTFLVFLKCEVSPQSLGTPTPSPCLSGRRDRTTLQTMGSMPLFGSKPKNSLSGVNEKAKIEEQSKLKAMVVDDIPYNQHLNKQFLEVCGVDVKYVAGDGLEAYKYYVSSKETGPIDLIFMDLDMPVMDGKTSCVKIREYERNNKLKPVTIVILTGNCDEDELKLCLDKTGAIKADYFYKKPLPLSDCQNLIQQIKREKSKKKSLSINLAKLADHILICEKDIFQQVLLENYLRVGQIKYFVANKDTILDKLVKHSDLVGAILYNYEGSQEFEESRKFVIQAQEFLRRRGRKGVPILGIIKESNRELMLSLKHIGFSDFLVKPFDYENVMKTLRSHTMNGMSL